MMAVWQRRRKYAGQEPDGQEQAGQTAARAVRAGAIRAQARRAEHAADTREALIVAARRLFARDGFDGTGTEQIVAEARVTRGALYHHFRDKADLFRAVMSEAAGDVAQRLIDEQLAAEAPSPLDEIRDGVSAFLDVCIGGDFQRIVLVDGPRVLGADAWEDLVDRYGRGLLEEWLDRAAQTGALDIMPVGALARLLMSRDAHRGQPGDRPRRRPGRRAGRTRRGPRPDAHRPAPQARVTLFLG